MCCFASLLYLIQMVNLPNLQEKKKSTQSFWTNFPTISQLQVTFLFLQSFLFWKAKDTFESLQQKNRDISSTWGGSDGW